jgi:hypothetical protein
MKCFLFTSRRQRRYRSRSASPYSILKMIP